MTNPFKNLFSESRKPFSLKEMTFLFFFMILVGSALSYFSILLNETKVKDLPFFNSASVDSVKDLKNSLLNVEKETFSTKVLFSGTEKVAEMRGELLDF